jgi:hypothetical protein
MMGSKLFLLILFGGATLLLADVQYEQTSRVTGGSLVNMPFVGSKLKEPQTTQHMLKGNRMAMAAKDSVTIYDLDKETVTTVHNDKREYSVMTFAEMREAMDKAMQKMQQATQKNSADMNWTVKVDATNESKDVNGFDAKKFIVTMDGVTTDQKSGKKVGTRMVMESWMSKSVGGADEFNAFNKKMAEKLGAGRMTSMSPMVQAQMGKGWYEAAKEFAKMEGFNVMTVTRMQTTMDGEVVMVPEGQQNGPQVNAGDVAKDAATDAAASQALGRMGRIGGIGGGLGGLRRNKKPAETPASSSGSGNLVPATTMEMTMEVVSFSRGAVDASKFDVPAGYKQVESEMKKLAK